MKKRKRKQKTPEQIRKSANRRQHMFHVLGRALFGLVLLAAAVLALTVFFKIDTIQVEGLHYYSAEEVKNELLVKEGDNLYLWNKVEVSEDIVKKFPYFESVQIRRHLPDKLVITVTESKAMLAVPSDGGYILMDGNGKVLEISAVDGKLPVATGVTLMDIKPGEYIDSKKDAYINALEEVLHALNELNMISSVDFINLQSLSDIRIGYASNFDIRVGTTDNIAYRLRFAKMVIEERLLPSDIGRLYWDESNRLHFVPDTKENIEKSKTSLSSGETEENPNEAADALEQLPDSGSEDGGNSSEDGSDEGSENGNGEGASEETVYQQDDSYSDEQDERYEE